MYQGLDYDLDYAMEQAAESGLYVSLCTITQPPGVFGQSGAPDPTAPYVPVAGMVDIPADVGPPGAAVTPTEVKELTEILEKTVLHVALLGYYPQISQDWRCLITTPDGMGGWTVVEYDIVGTQSSSQQRQSSLYVQQVTL